jgi:hypothetical protein
MIFKLYSLLSILIAYAKPGSGQNPFNGSLITYNSATATLQAALVGKGDMTLRELKAVSWAGIKTMMNITCLADVGIDFDVNVSIYIVLIDSQLIFDTNGVHIASFP